MGRRPGMNLSMKTVQTIYGLKATPFWSNLPLNLREHVGGIFERYILANGRITGAGAVAPVAATTTQAAGQGGPRGTTRRRNRNRIPVVNGPAATVGRRARGAGGPRAVA
jgi:hypothetical protein